MFYIESELLTTFMMSLTYLLQSISISMCIEYSLIWFWNLFLMITNMIHDSEESLELYCSPHWYLTLLSRLSIGHKVWILLLSSRKNIQKIFLPLVDKSFHLYLFFLHKAMKRGQLLFCPEDDFLNKLGFDIKSVTKTAWMSWLDDNSVGTALGTDTEWLWGWICMPMIS